MTSLPTRIEPWRPGAPAVLLLVVATVLVYLPVLDGYFLADDFSLFTHPGRGSGPLAWLLSHEGHIRPLAHLSMRVDFWLWGLETTPAHVVNLLWHLASTFLVGLLAFRITGNRAVAFAAALLFGVHPIHPPAVSWLSARFDLMCTAFILACVVSYDDHLTSGKARSLVLSLLCFLGALFSKELAVCVPLLLVWIALFRERRVRLKPLLPFAVLVALYMARVHFAATIDNLCTFFGGEIGGAGNRRFPFWQLW